MDLLTSMELETVVGQLLEQCGFTLALAESCTGGLVSHRITNVPGSSAYYKGSVTAYFNEIKEHLLWVKRDTLRQYGAVSEDVALEMAQGVRRLFCTDVGLAVTGIAGPSGGTRDKPVGLTYIALVAPDVERVNRHVWSGDRWENKERSAKAALYLLCCYLEERSATVGGPSQ
jgi:PncC family amidohydrolase